MADNKNLTAYQKLNQILTPSATKSTDVTSQKTKIVLRGDNPEDIRRKGLELQQKADLEKKFNKNIEYGYMKSMQFEAARLPAYLDYEGFENYPLIASALDLFMEESTTIGIDGNMLQVYSPNEKIKAALQELFYDIINVNVNLPYWVRNMCKYGDNFVHVLGEQGKGVTTIKQLVNYEMERIEKVINNKPTIKFKQKMTGDEFNVFEVAHFRLLGDDRMAPYGMSVLNKIRRVTRMLILAEDAMLTNRILRAADRKLIKIGVGNMDDDDIEEYVMKAAAVFKKQRQVDGDNGQFDHRFNISQNDEDWYMPVRNGDTQTGVSVIEGSQTLDAIHDIEYLRDNLFVGLGIPKPFLGFQDASGGGKNMAQLDVRFAKKVNRIQQAMIQELNKIAMIHLYLLGFSERELTKFTLSLTNPSTQHDLLKTELLQTKAQAYADLTRSESGIAAMSHTEAMRLLFNYSDAEIISGLKMMRMEKAILQELTDSALVIRRTGVFDDIDAKYNKEPILTPSVQQGQPAGGEMSGGAPSMGAPSNSDANAGEFPTPESLPPVQGQGDITASYDRRDLGNVLTELDVRLDRMLEHLSLTAKQGDEKVKEEAKTKGVIKENENRNKVLNDNALSMIAEIDIMQQESDLIKEDGSIEDIDISKLELE